MQKIFIVISSWSTPYEDAENNSVNCATTQYNRALAVLQKVKEEELGDNKELWYSPIELIDTPDNFFIRNQQESWFNVEIIEQELN